MPVANTREVAIQKILDAVQVENECHVVRRYLSQGRDTRPRIRVMGRKIIAARLILEEEIGRPLTQDERALHRCDNPLCVNPEHLFVGTQVDNIADMMGKGRGRKVCGEDHYNSKLTEEDVSEIRRLYSTGEVTQLALADQFNISKASIYYVVKGLSWAAVA